MKYEIRLIVTPSGATYRAGRGRQLVASNVRLQFDANGIALSFSVLDTERERVELDNQQLVELRHGNSRAFLGRVKSLRQQSGGTAWDVVAVDFKHELRDVPFFGRSVQKNDNLRWMRVKYAYTKADVTAGHLYQWTVGAQMQDVLNNMCGELQSDGLPTFADWFPTEIYQAWGWNYSTGASPWTGNAQSWITAARATSATHPFAALTRVPWGTQFDGNNVADVLTTLLRKYYPGHAWWINPVTQLFEIVDTYQETPLVVTVGDA
ncbi:MAG: hypothetical protein GX600_11915, partial [Dehalococcoidia bacterium]|nr:hypothetical protein [Dehalococcoidia bacterium]